MYYEFYIILLFFLISNMEFKLGDFALDGLKNFKNVRYA